MGFRGNKPHRAFMAPSVCSLYSGQDCFLEFILQVFILFYLIDAYLLPRRDLEILQSKETVSKVTLTACEIPYCIFTHTMHLLHKYQDYL